MHHCGAVGSVPFCGMLCGMLCGMGECSSNRMGAVPIRGNREGILLMSFFHLLVPVILYTIVVHLPL